MAEFIAVILITILAVVSPGADFAIVTKNSYLYGRKIGVFTSLGISLGVLVHVTYTLIAVAFVMTYTPQILNIVKYIGAIYLIYIGYKTFTQKPILDTAALTSIDTFQAIKYGFFMSFAHFVWFSLVAVLFSSMLLRQKMLAKQVQINKVIGSILCALGVILLFTQFQ